MSITSALSLTMALIATVGLLAATLAGTAWASTPAADPPAVTKVDPAGNNDCTGAQYSQDCNIGTSIADFISYISQHDGGPLSFVDGLQIGDCVFYESGRVTGNPATFILKDSCANALESHIDDKCYQMTGGNLPAEENCEQAFKTVLGL